MQIYADLNIFVLLSTYSVLVLGLDPLTDVSDLVSEMLQEQSNHLKRARSFGSTGKKKNETHNFVESFELNQFILQFYYIHWTPIRFCQVVR